MARKIIQIAACGVANTASTQCDGYLFALCDDGSVWCQPNNSPLWYSHSVIPDAPILGVAPSASANTGSPKLLDALERFSKRMEDAYAAEDTKYVHAYAAQDFYAVVKQLRAGA